MELMMEVISRQKFAANFTITHVFSEAGGYIGRSDECEWVLPDRGKRISRKHAMISCDGQSFYIEDISRNGIVTEPGAVSIKPRQQHKVEHGAVFILGVYTVQARLLHDPHSYIQPEIEDSELLMADNVLSLDPLNAMDQQENFEAKRRLGYYDDLLGETMPERDIVTPDHTSAATDSLIRVSVVPDEDVHGLDTEEDEDSMAWMSGKESVEKPVDSIVVDEPIHSVPDSETDMFFSMLGYTKTPESRAERERMLRQAAELLLAAVDGMHHCLRNYSESKKELRIPVTTMQLTGNNPLKFSATPEIALEQMLGPEGKGMLPAGKAMKLGFFDLHGHHMGLVAGARAAVHALLVKISPAAVQTRLDINGPVRSFRTSRLWHTFKQMHKEHMDDHDDFAPLFLQDFARAYEQQTRILSHCLAGSIREGD
jgi:type VI secretion system protein ImpI